MTKKLFIGGTGELEDDELRFYFMKFGEIQDAVIVRKQDGSSRGFGFVTFTDELAVEKCLVIQHEIKGRKVDLRRAVPRDQMASQQAMYMGPSPMKFGPGYGVGYPEMNMVAYTMAPSFPMGMVPPFINYGPFIRSQHIEAPVQTNERFRSY